MLVMLGLTIAVMRYTVFLNLVAYRMELAERVPHENFMPARMAFVFHHSGGTCLRYPDVSQLTDEEVKQVADEAIAARLGDELGNLNGFFLRWAGEEEQPHHGADEQDEILEQLKRSAGLFDQAILALNGRRMHDEAHADAEAARLQMEARATQSQEKLDPTQRAAIRPLWEKHKLACTTFGLVRVTKEIRRRTQHADASGR
jgi:hypothetical protein